MALSAKLFQVTTIVVLLSSFSVHAKETISIERAVQTALERDAVINVYESRRDAYKNLSISADTLPDPKIKIGFMNIPTDTYALDQEPMTQIQLGIQQMFPRGNSLEIKSQRALNMSVAEDAKTENQRRKVTREVRESWLELYYWLQADSVIKENRKLFTELVSVTKQQYAAGRQKQQDVIRSELELGMLDDREMKIQTRIETTQAKLNKYLGNDFSDIEISSELPDFFVQKDSTAWLETHPTIRMQQAMVAVSEKNVGLAKQSYKPSWSLDLTYGKRDGKNSNGSDRADFSSAMVMFDLPLFTADRQDKQVAASKFRLNSALNSREEQKRTLTKMWQAALAKEKRLLQRIKQYDDLLLPKSDENTKSALYAYQSGRSGFTALMRAQITELETQLRALRLNVEHKKTQALLLYLVGENS